MTMTAYFFSALATSNPSFLLAGRCDRRWLRNFLSSPRAPENMSHKNIITIHFHIWTKYNPVIAIFRACHGISIKKYSNLREASRTWSPNIAHSAWTHGILWNAIFTSSIGYVIDTLRFNNDVDVLYRLAIVLEMRLNHEYWYQCTWQTNNINKRATSDTLDSWASRHSRGIELVFLSLDCFTMRLFHSATNFFSTRLITRMKRVFWFLISIYLFYFISFFFFFWGGGGGGQL